LFLLVCIALWAKTHAPTPAPAESPSIPKSSVPPAGELRSLFPPFTMMSAERQQREEVAELAFRTLLQTAPVKEHPRIFLSIDDADPTDAFMQRFVGMGNVVFRKGSQHKKVEDDFTGHVVDRETGQRGMRLTVRFVKQSPTRMVVDCGWMWGV